jgi:hypothetical protein
MPEKELYRDWSAQEFWFKQIWLAWRAYYKNEYNKIIMKK